MSREWKPGDVAAVECSDGKWRQAAFLPGGIAEPQWVFADNARRWVGESAARPLVTIDPEDREAVERLYRLYVEHSPAVDNGYTREMQAALREYANPKPPKPDEPQGLGAVVEDEDGVLWTRVEPFIAGNSVNTVAWRSRVPQKAPREFSWPNIAAVRVLSAGMEVDQ